MTKKKNPAETESAYRSLIAQLTEARIQKGWTQYELAKRSGVSHTTISRIEALEYQPLLETLLKIADALGFYINIIEKSPCTNEKQP